MTSVEVMTQGGDTFGNSFDVEGSVSLNAKTGNAENAGDPWSVTGSMSYSLNGESKTDSISESVTPETVTATAKESSGSVTPGLDNLLNVKEEFVFSYADDEVHDYDVRVTGVDIGWMNKYGESYTTAGDIRTLWTESGGGDSHVTSVKDSSSKKITFTYENMLDTSEYGPSPVAGNATHFYMIFYLDGTGTDVNTANYSNPSDAEFALVKPKRVICSPLRIREAVAPTISYQHLWYWGEFNSYPADPGFRLIELQYELTPNDARNISVDATISATGQSDTFSWTDVDATGTVPLRQYATAPFLHSWNSIDESWGVQLVMHYTLEGVEKTETVTVPPASVNLRGFGPQMDVTYSGSAVNIDISSESDDPFTYKVSGISKIYFDWYKKLGSSSWEQVTTEQIYPGDGTLTPEGASSSYQYAYALPTEPPTGTDATHVEIRVESDSPYTGTDSVGTQTSNGPLVGYSEMMEIVSSVTYGDYLGAGTAMGFEPTLPIESDGFVVIFPLDESIVNDPNSYGSDESLTPVTINLSLPNGTTRNLLGDSGSDFSFGYDNTGSKPVVIFRYEAMADDQLLPAGEHTLTLTLSYHSDSVTNLRSTNSASFTVTVPDPNDPLGPGWFGYCATGNADKFFTGSVELLNGVTHDDLTNLSFTVRDTVGNAYTVPAAYINSSGSDDWVGFQYPESAIPTPLNDPATVTVSATYQGVTYSKDITVEYYTVSSITMEIGEVKGARIPDQDERFTASGDLYFTYDPSESYTITVNSDVI